MMYEPGMGWPRPSTACVSLPGDWNPLPQLIEVRKSPRFEDVLASENVAIGPLNAFPSVSGGSGRENGVSGASCTWIVLTAWAVEPPTSLIVMVIVYDPACW